MTKTLSRLASLSFAALAAASLTGCGIGTTSSNVAPAFAPSITGKAFGGPNPIIGATVKIYATGTAYGTSYNSTFLQEANQQGTSAGQDTDTYGNFSFAGGYNCPAGQFVYITATGGNTGSAAVNPNSVLVAALGRCEDLFNLVGGNYTGYKGATIYMNELTTIAAAYALGHFSSESGSGAATVVSIGAPSTNNAAQVSGVSTGCVANGTTCTTTQAAGLAHAFLNAASLVNVFANAGIGAGANTTVTGAPGSVVPQALINSIGNTLITCVNSTGGAAGDPSNCGKIFTATTIGSNVPTDTFGAMVNLAANPSLGGSGTAVANFYGYANGLTSVYQPSLSSSTNLNDFSIAISYPNGMVVGSSSVLFPTSGALDINDNYYAANQASSSSGVTNVISLASNGVPNGADAASTLTHGLGLSVDAIGNGYFVNGSGSASSVVGAFTFSAAGVPGTIAVKTGSSANTLKAYSSAVDRANNVWLLGTATSATTLNMSAAGAGSFTGMATPTVNVPGGNEIEVAIDPLQNVWVSANSVTSTNLSILPNSGTNATPAYANALVTSGGLTIKPSVGVTFAPATATSTTPNYTAYISAYNTTPGIQPANPTVSGATITAPGLGTSVASTISGTFFNAADGAGTIWLADTNSHSIGQYNPASSTNYRILPCYVVTTTTVNCTASGSVAKPIYVSVDAAGSIWTIYQGSTGAQIAEVIGSAAPTWPLLSLGVTGKP